ncbi:protein kinase [Candidatus Uabimicrobium sp. HlEnr_7]|uniref:protein kinase domain-containing protein n=1 Tax=Candidatus Uabimicrobium helgolandensis TaxID=3095367 RepID=UPI0035590C55
MSNQKQIENNRLLYDYLQNRKLIDEQVLLNYFQKCNEQGINFGHTLVQSHLLSVNELSHFFKQYASKTLQADMSLQLKLGVKNSDFGKYVLVEEIARGGMGIVYKAIQKDIKRVVALKVIIDSEKTQLRFFREAKATAALNHPHIVRVYEIGTFDNVHFFSMQYVEGTTLADKLQQDDFLEHKTRNIEWLIKIAEALHYSHEKGIIHRDIKPSNILIDTKGNPFLADFGLAKLNNSSHALTKTGEVIGTPFFMSPEQVLGRKIDLRTDVYSLGVILYQMLTKKLPFSSKNISQLYQKILREVPLPLLHYQTNLAISFNSVCLKCLEKKPYLRYQNAQALAKDLRLALQGSYKKSKTDRLKKIYYSIKNNAIFLLITMFSLVVISTVFFLWNTFQTQLQHQLQDVEVLIAQHQYNHAKMSLTELLNKYPKRAELYAKRARTYYFLKNTSQAFKDISTAIGLQRDKDYLLLKARWLREQQLYSDSLVIYKALSSEYKSKNQQFDFEIAETLLLMKRYNEALSIYNILLIKSVRNIETKLQISKIYFFQNEFHKSLQFLDELSVLKNIPDKISEEIFYYLGRIHDKQNNTSLAITAYKKALKNQKKFMDIKKFLGLAFAKKGEFSKAISYLKQVGKENRNLTINHTLARCYQGISKYQEAVIYYSKSINSEPWQYKFYAARAICYEKLGNFDDSGEDFLKASELGSNSVESLAHLYENLFHYRSLEKRYEIEKRIANLLLIRYQNQPKNLFDNEYQKLGQKCMDEYNNIALAPIPNEQQLNHFISILSEESSSAVRQIAVSALMKFYHSKVVLEKVSSNPYNVSLRKLHKEMQNKYNELQRKYARQLLVRYYIIRDTSALYELYNKYTLALKDIVEREQENNILRFFAIKILVHMRQVDTHNFALRKLSSESTALITSAALVSENIASVSFSKDLNYRDSAFLRMLQAKYLCTSSQELLSFLDDDDIRVRMVVADKLWHQGYVKAEKVFIEGFKHKMAVVRAFACDYFWSFAPRENELMEYTVRKYLPLLIKLLDDPDPTVQRIAILRISKLPNIKVIDFLRPLLKSPHSFVKLQALIAIGIRGDLAVIADFIQNTTESYLQASLFVVTKMTSEKNLRSLSLIPILSNAIENSNPHFSIFVLKTIGRTKEIGARYILKYLKHPREQVRLGAVLGLCRYGTVDMLPKLAPFLDSKNNVIQDAAAFTIMSIASRTNKLKLIDKYHKMVVKKNLQLNGAYAYVRDFHRETSLGKLIRRKKSIDWNVLYPRYFQNVYSAVLQLASERKNFFEWQIYRMNKAIELMPNNERYFFYTSLIHYFVQDYSQARKFLEKAIAIKPLTAYYYWLADIYYNEKEYVKALEALQKYQNDYFLHLKGEQLKWYIYKAMNNVEEMQKTQQRLQILELK